MEYVLYINLLSIPLATYWATTAKSRMGSVLFGVIASWNWLAILLALIRLNHGG